MSTGPRLVVSGQRYNRMAMDEPHSVTLNSTLAVCAMIVAVLLAAKAAFAAPGWVWVAGALFLALAVLAALAQSSVGGRAYLTGTLRTRHYTQVYRLVARRLNDWVWRRVGRMRVLSDGTEAPPPATANPWHLFRAALTWRLLDRALLIAVAYPVVALILPWLLGWDAVLGEGVVVFPAVEFWPERGLVVALCFVFASGWVAHNFPAVRLRGQRFLVESARWLSLIAFGSAVALASEVGGAFYPLFVAALAINFATYAASPAAFALNFSAIIVISFVFRSSGVFVGVLLVGLSLAVTVELLWSKARQGLALGVVTLAWALALLAVALIFDIGTLPAEWKAFLVFLAVLPLMNGLYDALSYALTLALSRKGLGTRWAPLWGLLDLALGAVLFLVLGATMVGVIAALNAIGTAPLYDLGALFAGLRASPGEYWWLYLILFSTLAPTALHILVAALAVQGWFVFQRPRRAVAHWIDAAPVSHPAAVGGCLAQALIWWLPLMALALGGWALWQFIGTWATAAGLAYLDILEGLARWIGAI